MTDHLTPDLTPAGQLFLERWRSLYPGTIPIAHRLKWDHPKGWVRFHSLPDAKRYADDQSEIDVILSRQNTLIDALVAQGQAIEVVLTGLDRDSHLFVAHDLIPLGSFKSGADEIPIDAWLLGDLWVTGRLDRELTLIADDALRAIIMAPDCLIAPYDGGIDIVLKDAVTASALKRQFRDWASRRDDGL